MSPELALVDKPVVGGSDGSTVLESVGVSVQRGKEAAIIKSGTGITPFSP